MDEWWVEHVKSWPPPKTHREVQVFLEFANFYWRFIHQFAKITSPITDLLVGSKNGKKTGPFVWTEEASSAFWQLIDAFMTALMLQHFQLENLIKVETDASSFTAAAVLTQQLWVNGELLSAWHPVAFYSWKLTPTEHWYKTHDAELLAIVLAFKEWWHYLEGSHHQITIVTDHNNLKYFMKTKELNGRQARWALKLAEFNFKIQYCPGHLNATDALSRWLDYESGDQEEDLLLPTLQNKLQGKVVRVVLTNLGNWRWNSGEEGSCLLMRQVTSSGVSAERVGNPQHLKGSYWNVRNASTELGIHWVDDRSPPDIQGTREPHTRMNSDANP